MIPSWTIALASSTAFPQNSPSWIAPWSCLHYSYWCNNISISHLTVAAPSHSKQELKHLTSLGNVIWFYLQSYLGGRSTCFFLCHSCTCSLELSFSKMNKGQGPKTQAVSRIIMILEWRVAWCKWPPPLSLHQHQHKIMELLPPMTITNIHIIQLLLLWLSCHCALGFLFQKWSWKEFW